MSDATDIQRLKDEIETLKAMLLACQRGARTINEENAHLKNVIEDNQYGKSTPSP